MTIIDRYLIKEIVFTLIAVIVVLLAAMLALQFSRFLGQAAAGSLTHQAIWALLALEGIRYLGDLIPVATLIAAMLVLGRLHRDSEMVALSACGYGPGSVYRSLLILTVPLTMVLLVLSFYLSPTAARLQYDVRERAQQEASRFLIQPGTFREIDGRYVVYVGGLSDDRTQFFDVFIHQDSNADKAVVIAAPRGRIHAPPGDAGRYLVLEAGYRYEGVAGQADYTVIAFDELRLRLNFAPDPTRALRRKATPTGQIIGRAELSLRAELQRRLHPSVVLIVLLLLAPLLARAAPREGRSARVIVAILIYAVYNNLLAVAETWFERGQTPAAVGSWWVHGLFGVLFSVLYLAQNGWPRRGARLRSSPSGTRSNSAAR